MGELSNTGQRHRRRAAGAARHRRRAGLPRPLPARVADDPAGRRRGGPAAVGARRAAGPAARRSSWSSVVWLGCAVGRRRARSRAGELVAFYGYSAFLMIPLRTATEYANKLIRGLVSAPPGVPRAGARPRTSWTRTTRRPSPPAPAPSWPTPAPGCGCAPGLLTAIVSEQPDESAAARRPARHGRRRRSTTTSRLGGVPLAALRRGRGAPPDRGLRHRRDAVLRPAGRPARRRRPRAASQRALATASADDILEALPEGLDDRRGRARPELLRRPAAAARAGPGADHRPRDPGARRADLRRRRPHRGPDRRPAARAPRRPAPRWSPPPAR